MNSPYSGERGAEPVKSKNQLPVTKKHIRVLLGGRDFRLRNHGGLRGGAMSPKNILRAGLSTLC
jgi:hypothetical protein